MLSLVESLTFWIRDMVISVIRKRTSCVLPESYTVSLDDMDSNLIVVKYDHIYYHYNETRYKNSILHGSRYRNDYEYVNEINKQVYEWQFG